MRKVRDKKDSFFVDSPIKSKKEDLLNRASLAEKIAEVILNFKSEESYVIGIEGEWGSGKTSLMHMMLETLREKTKKDSIYIINFNPWLFSSQEELIRNFFKEVSKTIGKRNNKFKEKLLKYGSIITGVSIIGSGVNFNLKELLKEPSLMNLREDIEKEIKEKKKKIIVIIDDIDRLEPQEVKLIFKLAKLVANFPYFIFILAYSRKYVEKALEDTERGIKGSDYLKKVVQIQFRLPDIDSYLLLDVLDAKLKETLELFISRECKDELVKNSRLKELYLSDFEQLFKNIRDVNTYINSLRLSLNVIPLQEINIIDFLVIEAIKIFSPEVYEKVANLKSFFTRDFSDVEIFNRRLDENDWKERLKNEYERVLSLEKDEKIKNCIDKLLKKIFPTLDFNISSFSLDVRNNWRRDKRICASECFDTYFMLTVPKGEISEIEIEDVLNSLNQKEGFLQKLEKYHKDGKLRKLIRRFEDYLEEIYKREEKQRKIFIMGLWETGEKIDRELVDIETAKKHRIFLAFKELDILILRVTMKFLGLFDTEESRRLFLKEVVTETEAIYFSEWILTALVNEIREYKGKQTSKSLLFSEEKFLRELATEKIRTLLGSKSSLEKMFANPRLFDILRLFKFFQPEKELFCRMKKHFLVDSSRIINLIKSGLSLELNLSEVEEKESFDESIVGRRVREMILELKRIFGKDYDDVKKILYSTNVKDLSSIGQQNAVKLFRKYGEENK